MSTRDSNCSPGFLWKPLCWIADFSHDSISRIAKCSRESVSGPQDILYAVTFQCEELLLVSNFKEDEFPLTEEEIKLRKDLEELLTWLKALNVSTMTKREAKIKIIAKLHTFPQATTLKKNNDYKSLEAGEEELQKEVRCKKDSNRSNKPPTPILVSEQQTSGQAKDVSETPPKNVPTEQNLNAYVDEEECVWYRTESQKVRTLLLAVARRPVGYRTVSRNHLDSCTCGGFCGFLVILVIPIVLYIFTFDFYVRAREDDECRQLLEANCAQSCMYTPRYMECSSANEKDLLLSKDSIVVAVVLYGTFLTVCAGFIEVLHKSEVLIEGFWSKRYPPMGARCEALLILILVAAAFSTSVVLLAEMRQTHTTEFLVASGVTAISAPVLTALLTGVAVSVVRCVRPSSKPSTEIPSLEKSKGVLAKKKEISDALSKS